MNWEQKLVAIKALTEARLCMRKPGDWYVSQSVEVKDGGVLCGKYGNGETPEAAVIDHWRELTTISSDQYLVTNAYNENRAAWRWNGFMWETVHEPSISGEKS